MSDINHIIFSGESGKDRDDEFEYHYGYEVFRDGRVCSNSHWRGIEHRELVQDLNSHGYPRVRLTIAGERHTWLVHSLVALYFLPPRPTDTHEICHKDGSRTNNHADNLRWGTRKENAEDRQRHGRTSRGAKHSAAIKRGIARAALAQLDATGGV